MTIAIAIVGGFALAALLVALFVTGEDIPPISLVVGFLLVLALFVLALEK